jgi:hypothetical protein
MTTLDDANDVPAPDARLNESKRTRKSRAKVNSNGRQHNMMPQDGLNDEQPIASTSKAVYVAPADQVQRYSRGKPIPAKAVREWSRYFHLSSKLTYTTLNSATRNSQLI